MSRLLPTRQCLAPQLSCIYLHSVHQQSLSACLAWVTAPQGRCSARRWHRLPVRVDGALLTPASPVQASRRTA